MKKKESDEPELLAELQSLLDKLPLLLSPRTIILSSLLLSFSLIFLSVAMTLFFPRLGRTFFSLISISCIKILVPFLDRLPAPSSLTIILSSLLLSFFLIFLGVGMTLFFPGLRILFGMTSLYCIVLLQSYHKIESIWFFLPFYLCLNLFIAISIDFITITYYLDYLEQGEVANKLIFFLKGYQHYLTILLTAPDFFFELLSECYDKWTAHTWYQTFVLTGAIIPCYVKYRKKVKVV